MESVLAQSFQNFELLVLDDGSVDLTREILGQFATQDDRVRILSRENRGLVATLNELISMSRGQYLARMDADDVCRPERFALQVEYLKNHPACVAVGSQILLIDPEGMPICNFAMDPAHESIDSAHLSGIGGSLLCHPSVLMRRDAVVRAGSYRNGCEYAEDIDLFLRLAELGELTNLPEVLLHYRQHVSSIGYARYQQQSSAIKKAARNARIRRGIANALDERVSATKPQTVADAHRKWAWWALMAGNVATARKHARKALIAEPFSPKSLKLAACAIRGY
jgi:glycosyltransferase involved in cell wall biosynthesis